MLGKLRRSNLSNFQILNIGNGMGAKIDSVFGGEGGEGVKLFKKIRLGGVIR